MRAPRSASQPRVTEVPATVGLPGGALAYTLRRSARARGMRVTIDPDRGVVVTMPPPGRRGWEDVDARIAGFLHDREAWIRRHVGRHQRLRTELEGRGRVEAGGTLRFRGELHRIRLEPAPVGARRSAVAREGDVDGDWLVVRLAARDQRTPARVVEGWCRERAREAVERAIGDHADALGVRPAAIMFRDPRTRWGSASRQGRLSFSWRLILAPPEALETVVVHELAHLRIFGHGTGFWDLVATRRPDHLDWRRWLRRHAYELHSAIAPPGSARRRA